MLSGLDKELAIRKQQRNALGQQKRGLDAKAPHWPVASAGDKQGGGSMNSFRFDEKHLSQIPAL